MYCNDVYNDKTSFYEFLIVSMTKFVDIYKYKSLFSGPKWPRLIGGMKDKVYNILTWLL